MTCIFGVFAVVINYPRIWSILRPIIIFFLCHTDSAQLWGVGVSPMPYAPQNVTCYSVVTGFRPYVCVMRYFRSHEMPLRRFCMIMSIKAVGPKERLSASIGQPLAPSSLGDKQVQSTCQEVLSDSLSHCSQLALSENRHIMWHSDHETPVFLFKFSSAFLPVLPTRFAQTH
jgi:hypothetical protein